MKNLKKLRLSMNLSQQALAEQLHISQQSIYKYENGITEPNLDILKNMAHFFDVSIDYIVGYSSFPHKIEKLTENSLTEDELTLLKQYRSLSTPARKAFHNLMNEYPKKHFIF